MNILKYEPKIWATADLLRGSGIKESEWPSFMMPFFALAMIESRLVRMFDELKVEIGEEAIENIRKEDWYDLIKDKGQGYNIFIFEKGQSLTDICKNDKSFEIDFEAYLKGFDGENSDDQPSFHITHARAVTVVFVFFVPVESGVFRKDCIHMAD